MRLIFLWIDLRHQARLPCRRSPILPVVAKLVKLFVATSSVFHQYPTTDAVSIRNQYPDLNEKKLRTIS